MAKKKNKPDFSKPKEIKEEIREQEMPDFITPGLAVDGITIEPDGTVKATGDVHPQDAEYEGHNRESAEGWQWHSPYADSRSE